ncbi:hypothetical protein ONZ45_g18686 [Pleurotus djamor]|nr:hypothetical protein ONZ45_g18686 [Pleurotus djamor]
MHTLTLALRSLLIGTFFVELACSAPLAIRQAQVGFEIGFGSLNATVPMSPLDALLDGTSTTGESGATPSAVSQTSGVSSSPVITSTTPETSQATLTVSSTTSPSSAPATPSTVSSTTSISFDSLTPSTPTSLSSESQAPSTASATTPPSSDSSTSSTEPTSTSSVEAPDATPPPSSDRLARPLVMGYYADWTAGNFPPEKVDFSRYDWIDFASASEVGDCRACEGKEHQA